ncbi:MAG: PQQ-like beta-propeller repeat protein, partial [Firmicutes bacterium]|nr:PQQ-like beta-propeller repeat protein [Bacillota bacterium]
MDGSVNPRVARVLLAVIATVLLSPRAHASWNQYGGCASRTHFAGDLTGLALYRRWRVVLAGGVHSPAAISGGAVYVGCDDGGLYSLDLVTGDQDWCFRPENGARIRSGAAVAEDVVVAAAADGVVYGIDRATGTEKWRFRAGLSVTSSVALSGDRAVVTAYDGRICSLSLRDGSLIWDYVIPGDFISASPTVGGGAVFAAALGTAESGGAIYALDEATGSLRWKTQLPGWLGNAAALCGENLAVVSSGHKTGGLYLLDARTGDIVWGPVRGENNYWS